jgi:hypothetical protein
MRKLPSANQAGLAALTGARLLYSVEAKKIDFRIAPIDHLCAFYQLYHTLLLNP